MKCGNCGRYANGICLLMDCETAENKDACPEYIEGKRQTCGECKHLNKELAFCHKCGAKWMRKEQPSCDDFEAIQPPTNGDVIRQGGDRALKNVIFGNRCYYCAFKTENDGCSRPNSKDCPDGIEAWLNAPAESEGEDE